MLWTVFSGIGIRHHIESPFVGLNIGFNFRIHENVFVRDKSNHQKVSIFD